MNAQTETTPQPLTEPQRILQSLIHSNRRVRLFYGHADQPKTGQPCSCRPGRERDNCPQCEGTGQRIDFAAIRARTMQPTDPMTSTAREHGQEGLGQ